MAVRTLNEFLAHSKEKDVSPDPFELENPHLLEVRLDGMVWSKAGAMVARVMATGAPATSRAASSSLSLNS